LLKHRGDDTDHSFMGTGTPNRVLVAAISVLAVVFSGYFVGVVEVPHRFGATPNPRGAATSLRLDPNDPWLAWIAPENVCPGSERAAQPPQDEVAAMFCLINFARTREGLNAVVLTTQLDWASTMKGQDIARCGRFEHAACGKSPEQVATDAGYTGGFGENLYTNESELTAPRDAIDGWLNSPEHRENLFRAEWRSAGVAAIHGATFGSFHDAVIWVSEFGDR
jgi:uncharacterized protein YkwD